MSRKSPVHVEVALKKGESAERLIKRFLRKCKKAKISEKIREKMYYKKPSEIRKEKKEKRDKILEKLRREEEEQEQRLSGTHGK